MVTEQAASALLRLVRKVHHRRRDEARSAGGSAGTGHEECRDERTAA
ncbi:MAG TPA: hypothetical protein VGJ13_02900 [Pseudonocardiaceae bacterium]